MSALKPLKYVELTLNKCSRTYGTAPCSAALGVTGAYKCYNSPKTCQDPAHFLGDDLQVVRWAMPTSDLPVEIDADPRVVSVSRSPQKLEPAEGLGVRESVTIALDNSRHDDRIFDNYINDRANNPYNKGTYWGKFAARWGNIQGLSLRTIDGFVGQKLSEMETRHYVVESTGGPDSSGNFTITAKDVIKLTDSDRALLPRPSGGTLSTAITATSTSFTLAPAGIGATYGIANIGSIGNETVSFTVSGDVITLTSRGLYGSVASDHDAGETLQVARTYTAVKPAFIVSSLLLAADVPVEYLNAGAWDADISPFVPHLYSARIMKPTPVRTLLTEIIREAGLIIFTDCVAKKIVVRPSRQVSATKFVNDDTILKGSMTSALQHDKRLSEIWTYYGKRNPLEAQDKKENYAAIRATVSSDPVSELQLSPPAIREILSRWISVFNAPAASAINATLLARYQRAPRSVAFSLPLAEKVALGQVLSVQSRIFEDAQGDPEPPFSAQILQLDRTQTSFKVFAEEVDFLDIAPVNPLLHILTVNENTLNIDLRKIHDEVYAPAVSGTTVRLIVAEDVIVGSASNIIPALDIGSWPSGVIIEIQGDGRIQGRGGDGGVVAQSGGTAVYSRYTFSIGGTLQVYGGGGAGGSVLGLPSGSVAFLGGGGAGYVAGTGASTETGQVTVDQPAIGTVVGDGGGFGASGTAATASGTFAGSAGGAGGAAIDGISFATVAGTVTVAGATIN